MSKRKHRTKRDVPVGKRTAAFFHSERLRPGFTPVHVGEGFVAYVQGVIQPRGTTLIGALDNAMNGPRDVNVMNGHYVSEHHPVISAPRIYIAVRGGCVQGVRYAPGSGTPEVSLVDYDDCIPADVETFERKLLGGNTWDEIEAISVGVF